MAAATDRANGTGRLDVIGLNGYFISQDALLYTLRSLDTFDLDRTFDDIEQLHLLGMAAALRRKGAPERLQRAGWAAFAIAAAQVAAGAVMVLTGLEPGWRAVHAALGTAATANPARRLANRNLETGLTMGILLGLRTMAAGPSGGRPPETESNLGLRCARKDGG